MKTKTPKVKTFIVSRKSWHRGQGSLDSAMCLNNGKKCCLGFVGKFCNIKIKDMIDASLPPSLEYDLYMKFPSLHPNFYWAQFSVVNDDKNISDKTREQQLKELAKKNGFRFKFVP